MEEENTASEFVYMRIDKHRKRVDFYEDWEEARKSKGMKRKFKRTHRYAMLKHISKSMGVYPTANEVDSWELPKWMKDWLHKRIKQEIYITRYGSDIYFKYKDENRVHTISKHKAFGEIYSFEFYIYDLLAKITEYNDTEVLYVYTDIAEILRLNRIYYDKTNRNRMIVKLVRYEDIYKIMGGTEDE